MYGLEFLILKNTRFSGLPWSKGNRTCNNRPTLKLASILVLFIGALVVVTDGVSLRASTGVQETKLAQIVGRPQTATLAASPAPSLVGSPHLGNRRAPEWKLGPASQMPTLGTGVPTKEVVFRGGTGLHTSTATGATSTPKIPSGRTLSVAVYNGLNKPGIASTGFTPPDSTGAIGPFHYVEVVNSMVHVWDRNLGSVSSATLGSFVGVPSNPYCDPQVEWDQSAGRWLYSYLLCNTSSTVAWFEFGWSKTSDPSDLANGWCHFAIRTDPFILDFVKLGHNSNYLIIGGNFYDLSVSLTAPPFVSAAMAWIQLPSSGTTTCTTLPPFGHTNTNPPLKNGDGVTPAFTPVPVNTDSSAGDGYILAAYDPAGNVQTPAPQNKLAVWHVDASGVLHQDPDIAVGTYDAPPFAPQLGTALLIDTLDARLTQAVGDPKTGIWTQHTVAGSGPSKARWYEVAMSGLAMSLVQEGDITSGSDYVFNASISPSWNGHGAVIGYNRSSSTIDPVIAARFRTSSTPLGTMESGELVLASSSAADTDRSCNNPTAGFPCRWGDYSGMSPDPTQTYVVWGTSEFNTASGLSPAWQNENFAVLAAYAALAPGNVTAAIGDASACVSWTQSAIDAGTPDTSYTIKVYQGATLAQSVVINAPANSGCVKGLTNGVTYTLTVTATNAVGSSPESTPSAPGTPTRAAPQSGATSPPSRDPANQAPLAPPLPSR